MRGWPWTGVPGEVGAVIAMDVHLEPPVRCHVAGRRTLGEIDEDDEAARIPNWLRVTVVDRPLPRATGPRLDPYGDDHPVGASHKNLVAP